MTDILPSIEKFPYAGLGLLVLIVANVVILFVWKLFLIVRRKVRGGGDLENQNGNNQVQIHAPVIDDNDWECPICMMSKENKIYTSCNHTFCEDCILGENPPGVWRTTFHPNKCNCPLCRQEITTIFPYNRPVSAAIALYNGGAAAGVGGNAGDNRGGGGGCTVTSYFISLRNLIYESPLLFRSFISFLSNMERGSIKGMIYALYFSWKLVRYTIAIFGCVTYILLPGDFFDERKYGYLGWLDDGLVFYILLLIVLTAYRATVLTVYQHDH
jgi:hypothetical protein